MKKMLLVLMLVVSGLSYSDGFGFSVEESSGFYEGDSIYDEYGINKQTGQTREYEQRKKREQDTRDYWNKRSSGEIPENMSYEEFVYYRDNGIEIEVNEELEIEIQ